MSASQFPPHLFGVYKNEMVSVSGGVLMLHAPPSYLFSESFVDVGVSPVTRTPPGNLGGQRPKKNSNAGLFFFRVVAHKEGSNSGPISGSTRWAPIMGAHLVRPFLGPENDRSFGARFFTDLNGFTRPTPKRKSRWSKNLGHETDGSHGGSQHGSGSCVCSFLGGATQYIQGTGKLKQS